MEIFREILKMSNTRKAFMLDTGIMIKTILNHCFHLDTDYPIPSLYTIIYL